MAVEQYFKEGLLWLAASSSQSSGCAISNLGSPKFEKCDQNFWQQRVPFGLDAIDTQFPLSGLPTGTIHEWFSAQHTPPCSIFALLAGNALRQSHADLSKFVVWIGRDIWPTPYLLEQTMYITVQEGARSVSKSLISNCLFIDPPNEKLKLWALELALRSPAVSVAIASCKKLSFATTRKLSLLARKSQALALLFCDAKSLRAPSSAFSRWHIETVSSASTTPCFRIQLLKCKGAQPRISSWVVELQEGVCSYEHRQQTLSLHIPSAVECDYGAAPAQVFAADFAGSKKRQSTGR